MTCGHCTLSSSGQAPEIYTMWLKHEWLTNVIHLTREGIINDVNNCIRYYNGTRLHSTLGYKTPNEYENFLSNVCN